MPETFEEQAEQAILERRPEARLLAAGERIDSAKANLYPSFALTGSVGTLSEDAGDLLDGDFGVFECGRRRGRLLCLLGGDVRGGHGLMCALELVADRDAKTPVDKDTIVVAAFTGNSNSDRGPRVLRSLQSLYNRGRLAGTGYLSILPVDQGIEHSGAASFAPNPG